MSDVNVYGAAENGSYVGASPRVDLAGTVPSGYTIGQIFANAMSDQETATITIRQDESNWAVYSGALWSDLATDTFDLSVATLLESAGTIADGAVEVLGLAPAVPAIDGSSAIDWSLMEQDLGTITGNIAVDLDLGHKIVGQMDGVADHEIDFTSGRGHTVTDWKATIDVAGQSPVWRFDGALVTLADGYDVSGASSAVGFSFERDSIGTRVSERKYQ